MSSRVDELLAKYGDTTDYLIALEAEVERLTAERDGLRELRDRAEAVVAHVREMRVPLEGILSKRLSAVIAALAALPPKEEA